MVEEAQAVAAALVVALEPHAVLAVLPYYGEEASLAIKLRVDDTQWAEATVNKLNSFDHTAAIVWLAAAENNFELTIEAIDSGYHIDLNRIGCRIDSMASMLSS